MKRTRAPEIALTNSLTALAGHTRRLMARRLAKEQWVVEAGFRPPAFGILMWVEQLQPVSQKEISDRLGTDPSDLVTVFDMLERAGFVSRGRDPKDRRRYALTLTPAGEEQLRRFRLVAAQVQDELLAPLDPDERAMFQHFLERVLEHQLSSGLQP
jgi:MarR family transcriptional regulator, lower aerobic nicotinate degradation pathway regulator